MGTGSRVTSPIGRLLGRSEISFSSLPPLLGKRRQRVDRRRVVVGQRLGRDAALLFSSPSIFLSGPGKTRGGGGNALTMRNGRCCVSARAMGQARCKCVACTFYSPFFPLFPSLSLSLSLSFFNAATSAVKTELVGWTGSPKLKGVAKSLAMNGLGKLVDDIANFRIINLDCGNWSICLFHKPFSLELYMKNHRRRIFPVEIFSPGKKYKCIAICNTRIKIIWYMHKSKYHARRVYQF